MRVCVPSYNRTALLQEKTLAYLERSGVAPADVSILVADAEQEFLYRSELPEAWGERVTVTAKGLSESRNFARMHLLGEGEQVFWLDDDIGSIVQRQNDKVVEEVPLGDVVAAGFEAAGAVDAKLWGIYPTANAFYMKAKIRYGLWHCVGCCYGETNTRDTRLLLAYGDAKEDYERCLRHLEVYGIVARLDWFAPQTTFYRKDAGGIQNRTPEVVEEVVQRLCNRWPGFVRRNPRRNSGFPEILLKRL